MNYERPKVSIIVPNYNHAQYLSLRLDSIINQSFSDFEILLLDDCSQDHSAEIIKKYCSVDNRIKAIFNEKNSGSTFKQWKKGLELARGVYVWIAESDDFAEPGFLSALVKLMDANPQAVLAYSNSWIVDESNLVYGTTADWKNTHFNTQHWANDYIESGIIELRNYLSKACTINNASAVLFRRSSLNEIGVDDSFRYTGDWVLYIKMSLAGSIAYTSQCLSNYREHSANASKKSTADGSQLFERLKCVAIMHRSGRLDRISYSQMIHWASREMLTLNYLMLRKSWHPKKMWLYMKGIAGIDTHFFIKLQSTAIKSLIHRNNS